MTASPPGPTSSPDAREVRRAVVCGTVGNAIEAYDFLIYALVAPLVFPAVFFPAQDRTLGVLLAFSTYFVAFLARPLGAVFFGHFGDRIGRKRTLVATILLMGIGTVGVGLVPGYAAIGPAGAWLLVGLRLLSGFAFGGEWTGSTLLVLESVGTRRGGFLTSFAQAANPIGMAMSTFAVLALTVATDRAELLAWAWRVPFLLSVVLVALGLWMRLKVHETPEFAELAAAGEVVRAPVLEVFRRQPGALGLTLLVKLAEMVAYYIFTVFILSFAATAGLDRTFLLITVALSALAAAAVMPLAGWLGDRVGAERVFIGAALLTAVFVFGYFPVLLGGGRPAAALVVLVSLLLFAGMFAVEGVILSRVFHRNWRYSGGALAFNLAGVVGAGPAPLIATVLTSGGSTGWLSGYVAVCCLVGAGAAAVLLSRRRAAEASGASATRLGAGGRPS
ncbi:MAG TPA: MFS transporter [Pseudonocardia sp.]|nr:MFS transporter [Pseudonocardia sp.]